MKELEYLNIISKTLADSSFLGDDCAYLRDLGIFVTQDTLVEGVHFEFSTTDAYNLGYKAIAVNLSDIAASAASPEYVTISLSLPQSVESGFVRDFYSGVNDICQKFGVKVAGGDLTGANSVMISVCAIGKKSSKYSASRFCAKPGDVVFVTGNHGESAAALKLFPLDVKNEFFKKHIRPEPRVDAGKILAGAAESDFALMDSSDGLVDALFKIAKSSDVSIEADFSLIPFNPALKRYFPENYKELVLWGGEDYELVGTISPEVFKKLDKNMFFEIGKVLDNDLGSVSVKFGNEKEIINEKTLSEKSFNHFKGGNS